MLIKLDKSTEVSRAVEAACILGARKETGHKSHFRAIARRIIISWSSQFQISLYCFLGWAWLQLSWLATIHLVPVSWQPVDNERAKTPCLPNHVGTIMSFLIFLPWDNKWSSVYYREINGRNHINVWEFWNARICAVALFLCWHAVSKHWYHILNCTVFQVITPEEIIHPDVDEHSVMTYLSQFPKAKLKPGAPLKPKLNPKKARAYGRGKDSVSLSCAEYLTLQKAGWGFLLMLNSRPTVTDFKVSLVYSWCGA